MKKDGREATQFKAYGNTQEKMYPRPFTIRLPESIYKKLQAMDGKERTIKVREAITRIAEEATTTMQS